MEEIYDRIALPFQKLNENKETERFIEPSSLMI